MSSTHVIQHSMQSKQLVQWTTLCGIRCERSLCPSTRSFFSTGELMLRNLTTQEYVRLRRVDKQELADAEVLAYHEEGGQWVGLEDILMAHISWTCLHRYLASKEHMVTLDYDSWAGHRLEIVLQDQIGEELDGWEDGG
jgi:hypothetical protein